MPTESKTVRRSLALPSRIAKRVKALAKHQGTSPSHVLLDLIELGLHSREQEQQRFHQLAERLQTSASPEERQQVKKELARMTFEE